MGHRAGRSACDTLDARDHCREDRVPELPGCKTHGKTYEEAVTQTQDAIDA